MDEKDNIANESTTETVTEPIAEPVEDTTATEAADETAQPDETAENTEVETDAEDIKEELDDGFTDDFPAFDGDDEDLLDIRDDSDGESDAEAEEESEAAEESDEAQEQTADQDAEPGDKAAGEDPIAKELAELKEQLAAQTREKERQLAALQKLGYDSLEEVRAYLEGVDVSVVKKRDADEVEKEAQEAEKSQTQLASWVQGDIADIKRKYPDYSPDKMSNFEKFAAMRGNPALRETMSAVDVYEFVERQRLSERDAQAAAKKVASKEHLKAGKARSVAAPKTIPRDLDRMLSDEFTPEEKLKYYKEFS